MTTTTDSQSRMALNGDIEEYLALVRAFPLVRIRSDAGLDDALAVFGPFFEKATRTPAEDAYLDVLSDLITAYEDATVHIRVPSGLEMLRHLVEENRYTQAQLAPIFGKQSVTSEVLSGKRPFALRYRRKAATFFNLPLEVFTAE